MTAKIHPSAIINPEAKLADGVEIGPYAVIGECVEIGSGTYVGPHCVIEFSRIGRNNRFTASAFIGMPPQDWGYHGEKTMLEMGNENIIREAVSLHRGSHATALTKIGSRCMFMANSHVGHDCRIGDDVVMVNSAAAAGHVEIGDKASISGLVGMHQFIRIGIMTMLGGGSMVSQDIPPYCRAQGDRARLVGLNLVGMRRNGFSRETIKSVKDAYTTLFLSGLSLKEAVDSLKSRDIAPEAILMAEFCKKSKRGIARPRILRGKAAEAADDE
ncbi:MAG: acyl-ACP--UDP-N-acetylglucosamine O-acyltransferase [bacterium]